MQRIAALLLSLTVVFGCSTCSSAADLDQRTVLVEFGRSPTSSDIVAVARRGAEIKMVLEAVQGVLARTPVGRESFEGIAGVVAVKDLGPGEDPVVSVFIHTLAPPTVEDLVFVMDAGGAAVSHNSAELLITAQMRISTVDALLGHPAFGDINVYPNTLHVA